jgi:hypothetical protein
MCPAGESDVPRFSVMLTVIVSQRRKTELLIVR